MQQRGKGRMQMGREGRLGGMSWVILLPLLGLFLAALLADELCQ